MAVLCRGGGGGGGGQGLALIFIPTGGDSSPPPLDPLPPLPPPPAQASPWGGGDLSPKLHHNPHAGAGMGGTPSGRSSACEQRNNCPSIIPIHTFPHLLWTHNRCRQFLTDNQFVHQGVPTSILTLAFITASPPKPISPAPLSQPRMANGYWTVPWCGRRG